MQHTSVGTNLFIRWWGSSHLTEPKRSTQTRVSLRQLYGVAVERVQASRREPPGKSFDQAQLYCLTSSIEDCPLLLLCSFALTTMIARSSLGRTAQRALRSQCCGQPSNCRGLAAPASGTFNYETGEAAGVKFATRDTTSPTTTLAVVAKAGTRYQILPGFADGLQEFAFKVGSPEVTFWGWMLYDWLLISCCNCNRQHTSDQLSELLERPSS